ncbi:MAG: MoaD/ThiS family protein [Desulfobacterales bacterium]|nr:MoaD/ThiS family protein [Desulfobacterales bacterium]
MITVDFYTTLRVELKTRQLKMSSNEIDVLQLLEKCEEKISKKFLHKLFDRDGKLIPGTMILVNGKNILHLKSTKTLVHANDIVSLFPPGGGG